MARTRRRDPASLPLLFLASVAAAFGAGNACSFDWEAYDPRITSSGATGSGGPGSGGAGEGGAPSSGPGSAGGLSVSSAGGAGDMSGAGGAGGAGGEGAGGVGAGGMGTGGMGTGGMGTGGSPPTGLSVQYKAANTDATSIQIQAHFKIVNSTQMNVPLSDLKIRYWFTGDGGAKFVYDCDFTQFNCIYTSGAFGAASGANADMYGEVSFAAGAGVVLAGTDSGEIQTRFHTQNFTNLNQTGDYSYDPTKLTFTDWTKVTLYSKGVLVWGVEP